MTSARGHHFVSQCYLRGFTDNGNANSKLHAIDSKTGHAFSTVPKNVAKQRDFNTIEGMDPGTLETALSGFESMAAQSLRNIVEKPQTEGDDWLVVLNLAALFAVRHPSFRKTMSAFRSQIAKVMMGNMLASRERWDDQIRQAVSAGSMKEPAQDYEVVKEFFERGEYTIETPVAQHVQSEFQVFGTALETFVQRKWVLVEPAADADHFITSDRPVVLQWSKNEDVGLMSPGVGVHGTTVLFPINKSLLAMGRFEGDNEYGIADRDQMGQLNTRILMNSYTQVYAASDRFNVRLGGRTQRGDDLPNFIKALRIEKSATKHTK